MSAAKRWVMYQRKYLLLTFLIVVIAVTAYLIYNTTSLTSNSTYQDVSVEQAITLIERELNLVIIDVRTEDEFVDEHIASAINIPLSQLSLRISELESTRPLLVYCRTANRSQQAVEILVAHNFSDIYHLEGGIEAWKAAKYPTEKG